MNDTKRMNPRLTNNNHIVVGASGSGKSAWLRQNIDFKQNRIIAYDPDEDFRLPRVRDIKTFIKLCKKQGFGKIRCALTVSQTEENFEIFSQMALAIAHHQAPMTILADEIAGVTRIGKGSEHWGELCRRVRKYGGTLYAATQRPEECDKTVFNQCPNKWVGALGSKSAYKKMAEELDISIIQLKDLNNIPQKQIEYWMRNGTNEATKEKISFVRRR